MKVAYYRWGELEKEETISKEDLKKMRVLENNELLGFEIRDADKGKTFYALEEYIDADVDGIAVKFAYVV
jgi:hypothetical protein